MLPVKLHASYKASLALAFSSLGDAFLYVYLPTGSAHVGVTVAWVGVLLSINRFARIFTNTFIVMLVERLGMRTVTFVAATLAILSTAGYVMASGIFLWLVCRVAWGLSFSALRTTSIGYSLLHPSHRGLALGISRALQESGPLLALFAAPVLISLFNAKSIFSILALCSLPALLFSWSLPKTENDYRNTPSKIVFSLPGPLNLITFCTSFIVEGVLIIIISTLFIQHKAHLTLPEITMLAAAFLAYRRICAVALSPVGGWIAASTGLERIFMASLGFIVIGLVLIYFGWIAVGITITFTFHAFLATVTPGCAADENVDHPLRSVAENATWRDVGAASGTLVGGLLITSDSTMQVIAFASFILCILLFGRMRTSLSFAILKNVWK